MVVSATIKAVIKLQVSVIKNVCSFIKKIHFDTFKKKKKKEIILILHLPRSSYDTRKTLVNACFTLYIFLRFSWITTLPNVWRKTCISKSLNQGFSMKGKVKDPILRTVLQWCTVEFLHYVNQFGQFHLYFIIVFSLVHA